MRQVTFSEQSLHELQKLAPEEQLRLIENIGGISEDNLQNPSGDFTCFQRDGLLLYRYRTDHWRIYFEQKEDGSLFCHYVLPEHSLSDFTYRFKLPVSETLMLEQHSSFWKYLEGLKKGKNPSEN
ncbi:MAG: cytotoxic translational repressor of toxin-antitoxin stability system [Puniceicoccales bacterium]|jgi:mRNA interferase RelE/StbE|nr:cytotoxic translational repressor of toxin-antitoxin stability system [Puniceicoccales bacterium]